MALDIKCDVLLLASVGMKCNHFSPEKMRVELLEWNATILYMK